MIRKKLLGAIYLLGVGIVCFLLGRMFIGGHAVINEEAMLPITYMESSSILLAVGALPMCVSSALFAKEFEVKKKMILFLPTVVTVCSFLYWVVLVGMEVVNSFFLR